MLKVAAKIAAVAVIALIASGAAYKYRHQLFMRAPQQKAFYFWKTTWQATPEFTAQFEKSGVNRLYMRFFDVKWDAGAAKPVSPLEISGALPKVEIVPVVYITNSVFIHMPYELVPDLSEKVLGKVKAMAQANNIKMTQLQIDCDWTDGSRRNYFHFVDLLRHELNAKKIQLSATIRLHQIKYAERTGIPPVNSGMLMFYNFGQIRADGKSNSIFNVNDARRYASYISSYRLPLDISLPMFSWMIHTRDAQVHELIEGMNRSDVETTGLFDKAGADKYIAKDASFLHGRYFAKGDELLIEETTNATTVEAADLAIENANTLKGYSTVALFDLDERNVRKYENSGIQKIFSKFE